MRIYLERLLSQLLKGMGVYRKYIKKFKIVCLEKNLSLKIIGRIGKQREYPFYSLVIDNLTIPHKTVCFSAGIHGDEIAGPLTIIKFLETFNPSRFENIKVIIFPVVSPSAFDKQRRLNYLNRELNGLFCNKRLVNENRILYNAIKNEKLFFFHALHEDIDETHFYLYNFENKKERIYREILKLAKKSFPINLDKNIDGDKAENGLIINRKDGSFEDRMFREGVPYSMCTETPGKESLFKRIACNVEIMNLVLEFSAQK